MKKQVYLPSLLLLALIATSPVVAQEGETRVEFTPFASFSAEGNFDDGFYDDDYFDEELSVDDSNGYGLIVGFPINRHFTVEVTYSRQDTELFYDGGLFGDPDVLLPLDIEYLHAGGALNFGSGHVQPFVFVSAGLTRFSPQDDFDDETRFSAAFGGGLKIFFTDNVGVRLQGRLLSTLVDDDEEAFCNRRDCYYYDADTYLYQAELAGGLVFAF